MACCCPHHPREEKPRIEYRFNAHWQYPFFFECRCEGEHTIDCEIDQCDLAINHLVWKVARIEHVEFWRRMNEQVYL